MKITPGSDIQPFPREEDSKSGILRDPDIHDLPRTGGKAVSVKNLSVSSVLGEILGVTDKGENVMKRLKKVETALFGSDEELKKCVGDLADAFVQDLKEKKEMEVKSLEPFEAYALRVQQDFYLKSKNFRERFINGFKVLQEQNIKDEMAKSDQKNPPPGSITL